MPGKDIQLPLQAPFKQRDNDTTRVDAFMKNFFVEQMGEEAFKLFTRAGLKRVSQLVIGTNTGAGAPGNGIATIVDPQGNEKLYTFWGGRIRSQVPLVDTSSIVNYTGVSGYGPDYLGKVVMMGTRWFTICPTNVAQAASVYYSDDKGVTWTAINEHTSESGITNFRLTYADTSTVGACKAGGKMWCQTRFSYADASRTWYLYSSADGYIWTPDATGSGHAATLGAALPNNFTGLVAWTISNVEYLFAYVVSGSANSGVLWRYTFSTATWAQLTTGLPGLSFGSFTGTMFTWNGYLCLLGPNGSPATTWHFYYSLDGTNWTDGGAVTSSLSSTGTAISVCEYAGMLYLVRSDETMWYTADGINWTQVSGASITISAGSGNGGFVIDPDSGDFAIAAAGIANDQWAKGSISTDTTGQVETTTTVVNSGFFDFAQNIARTLLVFKNEFSMYTLTVLTNNVAQVTDADYPPKTVRGLVYLDGTFYVMDHKGTIFGSDDEDPTSWNALNFLSAENEPDAGVFLGKYKNYVVALGKYTTEYFYNAGNATGSPLLPIRNSVKLAGCAHGNSVQYVDETMIWVAQAKGSGQNVNKGRYVVIMSNMELVTISTPDVDRILDASDFSNVRSTVFRLGGHTFYHLMLIDIGFSLVYDMTTKMWSRWGTRRDSFTHTMTGVIASDGTATGTFTGTGTHSLQDGDVGVISGFGGTYTGYNGTFNVGVTNGSALTWPVSTALTTSTGTGTITGWHDDVFPIAAACNYNGEQIMQDYENGNLYVFDPDTNQDDSKWIEHRIRLVEMTFGNNREKFMAWADIIGNRIDANVLLRMSDDDLQTWSRFKKKNLDQRRVRFNRLGSFHRRSMEMLVTDAAKVQLDNFVVNVEGAE